MTHPCDPPTEEQAEIERLTNCVAADAILICDLDRRIARLEKERDDLVAGLTAAESVIADQIGEVERLTQGQAMEHNLRRASPKGVIDGQWRCVDCGLTGTMGEVLLARCIEPEFIDFRERLIDAIEGDPPTPKGGDDDE